MDNNVGKETNYSKNGAYAMRPSAAWGCDSTTLIFFEESKPPIAK